MKITLLPGAGNPFMASGPPVVIASGGRISPTDFRIDGRGLLEVVERPRQAAVEIFNRNNHRTHITFSVYTSFGAVHGAEGFVLMRATQIGQTGIFTFTGESGAGSVARAMTGGVEAVECDHAGLLAWAHYTLVGGRLS